MVFKIISLDYICRNACFNKWGQWWVVLEVVLPRSLGPGKQSVGISEVRYSGIFIALRLNSMLKFRKLPFIKCLLHIFIVKFQNYKMYKLC